IPCPVRTFAVDEDDARSGVFLIAVRPDVEITPRRSWFCPSRALEPRMLVRRMVNHQLGDDANAAGVGGADETAEIRKRAVVRMHLAISADVVAVIQARRRVE